MPSICWTTWTASAAARGLIAGTAFLTRLVISGAGQRALRQGQYLSLLLAADGGVSRFTTSLPRLDLHGRQRQPVHRSESRRARARRARRAGDGTSLLSDRRSAHAGARSSRSSTRRWSRYRAWLSGRSAAQGGRDHSSHRLVAMGLSERAAVAVLWTLVGAGRPARAFRFHASRTSWPSLAAAVFLLAMIIFAVYLARIRVY